jgi:hypothetical protein
VPVDEPFELNAIRNRGERFLFCEIFHVEVKGGGTAGIAAAA